MNNLAGEGTGWGTPGGVATAPPLAAHTSAQGAALMPAPPARHPLFQDETLGSFFRRPAWSPDGEPDRAYRPEHYVSLSVFVSAFFLSLCLRCNLFSHMIDRQFFWP